MFVVPLCVLESKWRTHKIDEVYVRGSTKQFYGKQEVKVAINRVTLTRQVTATKVRVFTLSPQHAPAVLEVTRQPSQTFLSRFVSV